MRRSTPAGQHRPVLLDEILALVVPRPGAVLVDAFGWVWPPLVIALVILKVSRDSWLTVRSHQH